MSIATNPRSANGLVLTGGGARGAYQAGVLQGLAEIAQRRGGQIPFGIVTGSSAGAINAAFVAATADRFAESVPQLARFWSELRSGDIFRSDLGSLSRIGLRLATDVLFGGLRRTKRARSLLDTEPLGRLIARHVPFERIAANITAGAIDSFEVAATDYHTSESVSFVMSRDPAVGWQRSRRRSERADIGLAHVMASAAIPLFFPPVQVGDRHYGDGCLRNPAPLSPAIHLGARRLLIVGVRQPKKLSEAPNPGALNPTIGRVLSVILNAILMDAIEFDIERLSRINNTLRAIPEANRHEAPLRTIDYLVVQPSEDLGAYAANQFETLPETLQYLIGGLGSRQEASEVVSYLLFESAYCRHLAELGRADALRRRDELESFLYS